MNLSVNQMYFFGLHLAGCVALVVLMAIGKLDTATGMPLLTGLTGLGIGLPVTIAPAPAVPAAPVTPAATPAAATPPVAA